MAGPVEVHVGGIRVVHQHGDAVAAPETARAQQVAEPANLADEILVQSNLRGCHPTGNAEEVTAANA